MLRLAIITEIWTGLLDFSKSLPFLQFLPSLVTQLKSIPFLQVADKISIFFFSWIFYHYPFITEYTEISLVRCLQFPIISASIGWSYNKGIHILKDSIGKISGQGCPFCWNGEQTSESLLWIPDCFFKIKASLA